MHDCSSTPDDCSIMGRHSLCYCLGSRSLVTLKLTCSGINLTLIPSRRCGRSDLSIVLVTVYRTMDYVREEAPIIIHFHVDKCLAHGTEFFINDTHYRNQFETGEHKSYAHN